MQVESFPYLQSLLGAYFHQDCYDDGATDDEILQDFRETSHDYQRLGVRADIRRLLNEHREQLVDLVDQVLRPSILIGETNQEISEWLLKVESALED